MAQKKSNAEVLRRLRVDAVARGDCQTCRCRPAKPGRKTCQDCLNRNHKAKQDKLSRGRCIGCGSKLPPPDPNFRKGARRNRCRTCLDKINKRKTPLRNQQRQAAILDGRCGRCTIRPLVPGRKHCTECLEKISLRQRREHRERVNPNPKPVHCGACGELGHHRFSMRCPGRRMLPERSIADD